MENKNRTVFLLGAGAAMDWGELSTQKITNTLLNTGVKNKNNVYVNCYICYYFKIKTNQDINFEGLIDIIEQCIQYWLSDNQHSTISSILISPKDDFWENTFSKEYLNKRKKEHEEKGSTSKITNIFNSKLNEQAQFFLIVLEEIYNKIINLISNYSKDSEFFNKDKKHLNSCASSYFKKLSNSNILRIYTLNYDSIIQKLFKEADIDFFEGFTKCKYEDNLEKFPFDRIKTLTDFNSHCIYHLHGSTRWMYEYNKLLKTTEMYCYKTSQLLSNRPLSLVYTQKNKPLMLSTIISGYSKVERVNSSPFRQFSSAFDKDCHTADEIIIVGYSHGDNHINTIIREAMISNEKCSFTFVGDKYDSEEQNRILAEFTFSGPIKYPEKILDSNEKYIHSYKDRTFTFHKIYFKDFIENQ